MDTSDPAMQPIARDFQFDDIAPVLSAAGIDEVVLVQAAATEAETHYLLSLADSHSEISGVVGWSNIELDSATALLECWANHFKFKGIRPMLQNIEFTDWLVTAPHPSIWKQLSELGLRLDALVQPRHLPMLHQFCKVNENIPVVIDHAAKPKQAFSGDRRAFDAWANDMKRLGTDTQAFCKVSGLLTELPSESTRAPLDVIRPVFDVLLEHFSPSRLMWGSDWPVLTLASNYKEWDSVTSKLLNELSDNEKRLILGETAVQFYGLGETV